MKLERYEDFGSQSGDANLYGYVLQDPVNLTDPTGNCPQCIAVGVGAATGGFIGGIGGAINSPPGFKCTLAGAAAGAIGGALGGAVMGLSAGATTVGGALGGIGFDLGSAVFGQYFGLNCDPEPPKELKCQYTRLKLVI